MSLPVIGRSFRTAIWLGWQVESNWTSPLVFFAFSVLKPMASVLILVFMFRAVASAGIDSPVYAAIYLGNAFYIYVGAIMAGVSFSVLDDRERYQSLKYLYVAPISVPAYLLGRAVARFAVATIAVALMVVLGVLAFGLPIHFAQIDWGLFLGALLLGVVCLACLGLTLGAFTLTVRSQPWFIGEAMAAGLYLFSGAIFPLSLLPRLLQPIGHALPMLYWIELIRRSLLGPGSAAFPTLAGYSDLELLGIMGGMTLASAALAVLAFRFFDRIARERGLIDAQSNF